jgi:hypothetical protein
MIKRFKQFILEDKITGGKGDKLKPEDVDPKELAVGIEVEYEHDSGDRETAQDIALDHLSENPKYYSIAYRSGLFDEPEAIKLAKEYWGVSESLIRQQSIDQLKKVMKQSEKTDIGNRVGLEGGNLHFSKNPITSGIESYEDFEKKNKSFVSGWNTKNLLSPFK